MVLGDQGPTATPACAGVPERVTCRRSRDILIGGTDCEAYEPGFDYRVINPGNVICVPQE